MFIGAGLLVAAASRRRRQLLKSDVFAMGLAIFALFALRNPHRRFRNPAGNGVAHR
jgi:hypothetical protein